MNFGFRTQLITSALFHAFHMHLINLLLKKIQADCYMYTDFRVMSFINFMKFKSENNFLMLPIAYHMIRIRFLIRFLLGPSFASPCPVLTGKFFLKTNFQYFLPLHLAGSAFGLRSCVHTGRHLCKGGNKGTTKKKMSKFEHCCAKN